MVTTEQYLALSQFVYTDFSSTDIHLSLRDLKSTIIEHAKEDDRDSPVYTDLLPQMGDWTLIGYESFGLSGFAGAAFKSSDGDIVFSYRGTNNNSLFPFIADGLDDLAIATGDVLHITQFHHAYDFVWEVMNTSGPLCFVDDEAMNSYIGNEANKISFTGHSLGGGLAQYLTFKTTSDEYTSGGKAVTFDAVGIGQALLVFDPLVLTKLSSYNVQDHVNTTDIIGNYGFQLGQTTTHIDKSDIDYTKVDFKAISRLIQLRIAKLSGKVVNISTDGEIQNITSHLGADSKAFYDRVSSTETHDIGLFARHGLDTMIEYNTATQQYQMTSDESTVAHSFSLGDKAGIYRLINAIGVIETARSQGNYHNGPNTIVGMADLGMVLEGTLYFTPSAGATGGYTYSTSAINQADKIINDFARGLATNSHSESRSDFLQGQAASVRRVDPLILDLDGDGIETIKLSDSSAHFDLDLNGLAEATSWASPDDGFLTLDRNSDGVINNVSELFGDRTLLSDGITYASSGFQALAEFDENQDGIIDINDTAYSQLRIWRDSDGDGVSSNTELKSLTEYGITSINLGFVNTNTTDASNNIQTRLGYFIKSDGTQGAVGEYLFERNTASSTEDAFVDMPSDIAALPDLQGSGNVTSLHKAILDDTSGTLRTLVESFISEPSISIRNSLMQQILIKWTGSDGVDPASRGPNFDAQKLAVMEKFFGVAFTGTPAIAAIQSLTSAFNKLSESMYSTLMAETWLKNITDLMDIDNNGILSFAATKEAINTAIAGDRTAGVELLGEFSRVIKNFKLDNVLEFSNFRNYFASRSTDFARAIDFAGSTALIGTDGNDSMIVTSGHNVLDGGSGDDALYSNTTSNTVLYGGSGSDMLHGSYGNDILDGGIGDDILEGGAGDDTYAFGRGYGTDTIYDSDATQGNIDTVAFFEDVTPDDVTVRRNGDNLELTITGTTDKLTVERYFSAYGRGSWWQPYVGENANKIEQFQFADGTIWDVATIKEKARITLGTAADDSISGFSDQDDIIDAGSGDDIVWTSGGNDLIVGDEGNDYLQGGNGDDTYVFNVGDGHDTIYEDGGTDTIRFGEGINPTDVTVSRVTGSDGHSYDLELTIAGTADKITITQHFGAYQNYVGTVARPEQVIEKIVFADETEWDLTVLYDKAHAVTGTDGADYIYGWDGSGFTIISGDGDDYIAGNSGNDTLQAGNGNDSISGSSGNDTLVGGSGNDYLQAGEGDDVYVFNIGDGEDTIYEGSGNDAIRFGAGINPADVKVARVPSTSGYEYNLEITIAGTDDKITVTQHFGAYQNYVGTVARPEQVIEKIEFADGTVWTQSDIYDTVHNVTGSGSDDNLYAWDNSSFAFSGENGNDSLNGGAGNDNLYGGAGNDSLSGGAGSDLLDSGTGDDYLQGGTDDDVYVFNVGDGQDTIYEGGGSDTIRFGAGVDPADIHIARVPSTSGYEYNLEITIAGTTDKITVTQHFGAYQNYVGTVARPEQVIERIEFADGTVWTQNDIYNTVHNVTGTVGDDNLYAWDESSFTFTGDTGNDSLSGGNGNDTLQGGDGHDTLSGATGDDLLEGGAGDDYLQAGEGDDTYVFNIGDGQDTIYESNGTDKIKFGTGINPADVHLARVPSTSGYEYNLEITIAGTDDKITVTQHFGAYQNYVGTVARPGQVIESVEFADGTVWTQSDIYDTVHNVTGTGNGDSLSAWDNSAFTLSGEGGDDYLSGGSGDDALHGGAGQDSLYGSSGNDLLVGDTGNDNLAGGQGDDAYVFALGDGQDTISEEGGVDTLQFAADITPADIAVRRTTADNGYSYNLELSVIGTDDKVTIYRYFGGYGNYSGNYATPQNVVENIVFADGTTWMQSDIYNAVHNVTGTGSDDNFYAWDNGNFTFQGLDGNDYLQGGAGDDVLNGGSGNDSLYANGGNDTLLGGVGSDTLSGGLGDDIYVFSRGDGNDMVSEDGGADTIQFGADINPADVIVERVSADNGYSYNLVLSIAGTDDKLTVYRYFGAYGNYSGNYATPQNVVENFIFADGTIWNGAAIYDKVHNLTGTEGSDYFAAWGQDAFTYNGLAGDDTLVGNTGNDTLLGGDGSDQLYGSNGNDILDGGSDNDVLYGDQGNDTLVGAAGNDQLYSGEGNDVLDGGTGNDILEGGTGDDTYVFGLGYGQDTIYDSDVTEGNSDIITLLEGINPADVSVKRAGDHLELSIIGTSDKLTVENYFSLYRKGGGYYSYVGENGNKIEQIQFADGTIWDVATIKDKARHIDGTDNDEYIYGLSDQQNIISGKAGNDVIYGSSLGDSLSGDEGNDSIFGSYSNDTINGGVGNDILEGNQGNDTYVFGAGFGIDTIFDSDSTNGNVDVVTFLEGISPADVTAKRIGDNLELAIAGTDDKLTVERYFSAYPRYGYYSVGENGNKIEQFQFADGTIWDIATIKEKVRYINGTDADDSLSGFSDQKNIIAAGAGNDTIYASYQGDDIAGEAGNDTIYGSSGNDTLDGGTGDDILEGSYGNDTYVFGRGYGSDTIYDSDSTVGNTDIVTFLEDVAPNDVAVKRNGDNLELTIAGTTDKLTIERYFSAYPRYGYYGVGENGNKVEQFQFSDGTVWDIAAIKEMAKYITGTENDDYISGFSDQKNVIAAGAGNDTIYASYQGDEISGEAGNDTIHGSSGADRLIGGIGNDVIDGGTGNDSYVFALGDGQDVIYDNDNGQSNGLDVVEFGEGINASDVTARRLQNDDLELTIAGTSDKLTIERYFSAYYKSSSWYTGANSNKIEELRFADGTVWDITAIKDKVRYISGTSDADSISGFGDQQNIIAGGAGDDNIYAGSGLDNSLNGESGNDNIYGSSGNDQLDGGTGNDRLEGSVGNDTYVFGLGSGTDVIYDSDNGSGASLDIVEFTVGVSPTDVRAKRLSNGDLELTIDGTSDTLTIERFFSYYYKNSSWYTGATSNAVEQFHFDDGTVWGIADIKNLVRTVDGTEASESLYGYEDGDTITALGGNDYIYASSGNDTLYGGSGDDYLYGEGENDTLDGGVGNDHLDGGASDDTYVFSGEFGADHINDYSGNDLVRFDQGQDSLIFQQSGSALQVLVAGSTNSVTVDYAYQYNDYKVETFKAADGSTISNTQVDQLIQAMASFSNDNSGISWSQALIDRPQDVQAITSQYWTAPTA